MTVISIISLSALVLMPQYFWPVLYNLLEFDGSILACRAWRWALVTSCCMCGHVRA